MSIFTDRLSELIESKNITKKEFAEAIGVPPPQVTYYLGNREPNYDKLVEIANYFNVSTDYLTGRDESKNPVEKTISEHLNEIINQSEMAKEVLENYPIDKTLDEYFKNLLEITFIQTSSIKTDEMFECVVSFNRIMRLFCIIEEKFKNGNYDVLDEIKNIKRNTIKTEIIINNNSAKIIKNIYEDETIDQEIRNRVETSTSYRIKDKTNKDSNDEISVEAPEAKADVIS